MSLAEPPARARRRSRPAPAAQPAIARSWVDEFGSVLGEREGGIGGRTVLLVAPPAHAEAALAAILAAAPFKGRLVLAVPQAAHTAPLEAILRAVQPTVVIAVEDGLASLAGRGPALTVEPGDFVTGTGLAYHEPGDYPAWEGWPGLAGGRAAESRAASLATARGLRALACGPGVLAETLDLALVR